MRGVIHKTDLNTQFLVTCHVLPVTFASSFKRGTKMNRLQVFVNGAPSATSTVSEIFYSRFAGGPYYRWSFEQSLGKWRGARVNPNDFALKSLSASSWKSVPDALQTRIGEHYPQ